MSEFMVTINVSAEEVNSVSAYAPSARSAKYIGHSPTASRSPGAESVRPAIVEALRKYADDLEKQL